MSLQLPEDDKNLEYLIGELRPSLLELQQLTYLDLSFFKSPGNVIPEFIGSLKRLKYLNLSYSSFVGSIPVQLGNLSILEYLDLGNTANDPCCNLVVKNLNWLSHLSSLRHLDLSYVNLSHVYDWQQAVSNLPSLTTLHLSHCNLRTLISTSIPSFNFSQSFSFLDLSYNNFSIELSKFHWLFNYSSSITSINLGMNRFYGIIPEDFEKMQSLEHLNMSWNMLEGEVSNSIGNLSNLRVLDLSCNKLNGTVPPSLGKLPNLEILRLSMNHFQGAVPDFLPSLPLWNLQLNDNQLNRLPQSINLSELVYLDVSSNRLSGSVYLQNLSKLRMLHLSCNSLTLKFSSDWVPPSNLTDLQLPNCKIGPHFPSWLQSQKYIKNIDLSGSGLVDTIPNWFGNFSSQLRYVNMSNNHINGILPRLSLSFETFPWVDFSTNNIEGLIPIFPYRVAYLSLSNNKLKGSSSICNQISFLQYLDLSNNLLSGKIPDCLMESKLLNCLNLDNNNFSGSIPSSIGQLFQIESLHLRNNSLDGELPTSLGQCTLLKVIDIGQNKFRGRIPRWLGRDLHNLIILSFQSNQFHGEIPSNICNLNKLQILDLSNNNIFGIIPNCLRNLTTMAQKESSNDVLVYNMVKDDQFTRKRIKAFASIVVWKGIESKYTYTLGLVKIIDLSRNNLTGELPLDITYLEGLLGLNISRNNLHGKIPPGIGHLQLLDFLDLSRNQLSGVIPRTLSQLSFIGVLDLSSNNLSGRIPSSTQLQSFNASSYSGNSGLSGLPLPKLCPEDGRNFASKGNQDSEVEGKERFIDPSFYTALGIGFTVGLWGTLGSLIVNSSCRISYFRLVSNMQDLLYVTIIMNTTKLKRLFKK